MSFSSLLATLLLLASPSSGPFQDTIGHPHAAQIEVLRQHGIVQGYEEGHFGPDLPVNRAEFLKVLMLAAFGEAGISSDTTCFTDFTGEEQWYWKYACSAKEHGLVAGYPDGTFRGDQPIILAEAAKMTVAAWKISTPEYSQAPDHWYDPFLDAIASSGAQDALGGPDHLLTRSDMAWLLVSLRQPLATIEPPASSSLSSSESSASASQVDPSSSEESSSSLTFSLSSVPSSETPSASSSSSSISSSSSASSPSGVASFSYSSLSIPSDFDEGFCRQTDNYDDIYRKGTDTYCGSRDNNMCNPKTVTDTLLSRKTRLNA